MLGTSKIPNEEGLQLNVPISGGGTFGGTPCLDTRIQAGHAQGLNPGQYWLVHVWTGLAILLVFHESFVRDQGVGGSNPLAPIHSAGYSS